MCTNSIDNNENSAYVIQEQGDLGLGTIEIDSKFIEKNGEIKTPELDLQNNT